MTSAITGQQFQIGAGRERTFTIDDLPTTAGMYADGGGPDHPADTAA